MRPETTPHRLEDDQAALIDTIYTTAAEPEGWGAFLKELVAVTGSRSARMLVMNAGATRVESSIKVNIDDGYHRQYVEHYVNTCPWRPELRIKPPGRIYSTYLDFSCRQPEFYRTEFFNDWAGPQDIHHGALGTVHRDSSQSVQLLVQRTRGQGHYTRGETAFLNELVPHLRRSFLLARQIGQTRVHSEAIALAAAQGPLPFLLLDRSTRVTYISPGAEELIVDHPLLFLKQQRLHISDRHLHQRLRRLIRQCVSGAESRRFATAGASMALMRASGSPVRLIVTPIHPDVPGLFGGAYTAIFIHDPEREIAIESAVLCSLYGLSDAEARFAAIFASFPQLVEAARQRSISVNTARAHLKSIFRKTGTRSQAELVKFLLTGPQRKP